MAYSEQMIKNRDIYVNKYVKQHGDILCHYTSIPALHGILKDKEFWLGSTASMNDRAEIKLFINELRESLCTYRDNECYKSIFGQLDERLADEENYPFAMALSSLEDNAAQWERYADNARGCCIVFNLSTLRKVFFYQHVFFDKVFYDYEIRNHDHYKSLDYYFSAGKLDGNDALSGFTNEKGIVDNIYACAYARKHKSFCTEKEYRISTISYKDFNLNHSNVDFIISSDRVRRILKVNMNEMCKEAGFAFEDLFDKIILGPRKEQSTYELQAFIRDFKGYKDLASKVVESECTLR